jgi:putative addiction module CopG family antidote
MNNLLQRACRNRNFSLMNIRLTKRLDRYVADKIAGGRYESASEVIREALRQMEEREQRDEPASLQAKITAGFRTPLRPVTDAGWRGKWNKGLALAQKLRAEHRRAA